MTDDQITNRGWSVPIYRAVEAAGGPVAVANAFGFRSATTPMHWYKQGTIQTRYIDALCKLGGYAIKPGDMAYDVAMRRLGTEKAAA